jgi:hypothetical protein
MNADGTAPTVRGARGRDPAQRHLRVLRALLGARLGLVTVTATIVAGCSSTGATSAPSATAPLTVTSTLAGRSILPLRVYWEATGAHQGGESCLSVRTFRIQVSPLYTCARRVSNPGPSAAVFVSALPGRSAALRRQQ